MYAVHVCVRVCLCLCGMFICLLDNVCACVCVCVCVCVVYVCKVLDSDFCWAKAIVIHTRLHEVQIRYIQFGECVCVCYTCLSLCLSVSLSVVLTHTRMRADGSYDEWIRRTSLRLSPYVHTLTLNDI